MSKDLLIALAGGVFSAAAANAFLVGSPGALLLVYVAPLPVMMSGLALGPRALTIATAVGFLAAGAMGGLLAAGLYGLIHGFPAWLVIRQALLQRTGPDGVVAWFPAGASLSWLTVLCASLFLIAAASIHLAGPGIQAAVVRYLHNAFAVVAPTLSENDRGYIVALLAPFFPGAMGASWVLMVAVNGILAQAIVSRLGRNLRPSPRFADLTVPDWMSWLLVGAAVIALAGPGELAYVGRNLALILVVPFFFLGLAVIHKAIRRFPFPGVLTAAFYLVLILSVWAALVVAGVGLVEQWVGLRRRLPGARKSEENE